jgi:antitoxin component of RelBE/YafQ-DinJ toxin-antitoxin module
MSNATLTIRTDDKTKRQITDFAASVGLSTTNFMLAAAMQAVRTGEVRLTSTLEPTPYLEGIIKEAEIDYEAGRNITTTKTTEETLAHLKSL